MEQNAPAQKKRRKGPATDAPIGDTSSDNAISVPPAPQQTDPAPKKKDKVVLQEERDGLIKFEVVRNDKQDRSLILLTGLQGIIQKQLPNMPKEYISRLVYDRNHESMAVVKDGIKVMGGITYRLFLNRKFAEIVFCAIASEVQVKGYGARLMSWVKDHVREAYDINYFLTYADNFAIGYFKKQGFTTEITLDKSVWIGYIKDYEGGTLMECSTLPQVKYRNATEIISAQRQYIHKRIRESSASNQIVHPGLTFPEGVNSLDPATVPGIKEAGWSLEMNKILMEAPAPKSVYIQPLLDLIQDLKINCTDYSWPFLEPVAGVPDYYKVIRAEDAMDLSTLSNRVASNHYKTLDEFAKDAQKIFDNCRYYNDDSTQYYKCANKLEKIFKEKLKDLMDTHGWSFAADAVAEKVVSKAPPPQPYAQQKHPGKLAPYHSHISKRL